MLVKIQMHTLTSRHSYVIEMAEGISLRHVSDTQMLQQNKLSSMQRRDHWRPFATRTREASRLRSLVQGYKSLMMNSRKMGDPSTMET